MEKLAGSAYLLYILQTKELIVEDLRKVEKRGESVEELDNKIGKCIATMHGLYRHGYVWECFLAVYENAFLLCMRMLFLLCMAMLSHGKPL